MSQSKGQSFQEALLSTAIGYVVSFITWYGILWTGLFDINVTFTDNLIITLIFTVVSVVRSYVVRRYYNRKET